MPTGETNSEIQPVTETVPKAWIFPVNNGFAADVGPLESARIYSSGDNVVTIPKGEIVADVDFTPIGGMPHFIPSHRYEALGKGLEALSSFFQYADEHCDEEKQPPVLLVGQTNRRMAVVLKRLGFDLIEPENPNGKYVVIGKAQVVRNKLQEIKNSRLGQRLKQN